MKSVLLLFAILAMQFSIGCGKSFSSTDSDSSATGVTATPGTTTGTTTGTTSGTTTCQTGYVYSSTYGCLPQGSCSSGYGWYNNNCVLLTGTVSGGGNRCQDYCPAGQIATDYGCMPVDPGCPPCSGLGRDGFCYWSTYTLDTGLTY